MYLAIAHGEVVPTINGGGVMKVAVAVLAYCSWGRLAPGVAVVAPDFEVDMVAQLAGVMSGEDLIFESRGDWMLGERRTS